MPFGFSDEELRVSEVEGRCYRQNEAPSAPIAIFLISGIELPPRDCFCDGCGIASCLTRGRGREGASHDADGMLRAVRC
jgi:hypothetical protein